MDDAVFHAMADSLLSGRYSLLIGAGASLDSTNYKNIKLMSGSEYVAFISDKKGIPPIYPLQDVYSMLTDEEVDRYVTDVFAKCTPGPTLTQLTEYIWNRIFTLNIDDATEAAYELEVT